MAEPTQILPSWLSKSLVTLTEDGINVVQTTLVELPQTYFGPSIPLGPGWVFGGSTSPASSPTPAKISTSTSTSAPTPTSTTSSSFSFTLTSSLTTSTFTSSILPVSSPVIGTTTRGLSFNTRLVITLSIILGSLLLIVLGFIMFRLAKSRRAAPRVSFKNYLNRSPSHNHSNMAGSIGQGEGQILLSEEPDMRPAYSFPWSKSQDPGPGSVSASPVKHARTRAAILGPATDPINSASSRKLADFGKTSTSSIAAGSLFLTASQAEEGSLRGPAAENTSAGWASSLTDDINDIALSDPSQDPEVAMVRSPRTVTSVGGGSPIENLITEPNGQPRLVVNDSLSGRQPYTESSPSQPDENVTLLTARGVTMRPRRMLSLATLSNNQDRNSAYGGSSRSASTLWRGSQAFGGLSALVGSLDRFSWFKRIEHGPTSSPSQQPSLSRSMGSGSNGGSKPEGQDGLSVYHSTYARPQSPVYVSTPVEASARGRLPSLMSATVLPLRKFALVSERSTALHPIPVSPISHSEPSSGLHSMPLWDRGSQDENDSEDTQSQSRGDWSSMTNKKSNGEEHGTSEKRYIPVTRNSKTEQQVQIVPGESGIVSKKASLSSDGMLNELQASRTSPRSAAAPVPSDFTPTPREEGRSDRDLRHMGSSNSHGAAPSQLSHPSPHDGSTENYDSSIPLSRRASLFTIECQDSNASQLPQHE